MSFFILTTIIELIYQFVKVYSLPKKIVNFSNKNIKINIRIFFIEAVGF